VPPEPTEDLARFQRRFFALVVGKRELPPDAPPGVEVHRRMYRLRLERELAREFPATRRWLGAARFGRVARAYLATHVSRSFTLAGYGAALPRFLARESAAAAELARLERELALVAAAGPGRPRPGRLGPALRLSPAPGARLVAFAYDVERAYAQRGAPRKRAVRLALFQRGGAAVRLCIGAREAPLLAALLRGARLDRAVAAASRAGLGPARIQSTLAGWLADGLFAPHAGAGANGRAASPRRGTGRGAAADRTKASSSARRRPASS